MRELNLTATSNDNTSNYASYFFCLFTPAQQLPKITGLDLNIPTSNFHFIYNDHE